jgi:hypothetical protein
MLHVGVPDNRSVELKGVALNDFALARPSNEIASKAVAEWR